MAKIFIYITDTTLDGGPHEYVEGTNKVYAKHRNLLKKGYKRIDEKNIYNYYDITQIKKILGKKGTIFVGDTSCFHRGYPPIKNDRLLLVLEYSKFIIWRKIYKIKTSKNIDLDNRLNIKNKVVFE